MRHGIPQHPLHHLYRTYCASGHVLGTPMPTAPIRLAPLRADKEIVRNRRQAYYQQYRKSLKPYKPHKTWGTG